MNEVLAASNGAVGLVAAVRGRQLGAYVSAGSGPGSQHASALVVAQVEDVRDHPTSVEEARVVKEILA